MKKRERKSEADVILISLANIGRCLILYSNTDLLFKFNYTSCVRSNFHLQKENKVFLD